MTIATVPADAGDWVLPPTVEDVKPCPSQGAGFVRLPGSPTCIRLGGRVTAGLDARVRRDEPAAIPVGGGRLAIDTRTETEYGPVRAYLRVGAGRR